MTKPVAYLVLAHADPEQCTRLISSLLADPNCHIFVHLDLKTKSEFSNAAKLDLARVHFVKERYEISWGGFSMIKGTLAVMKQALASKIDFGYLVLLSGMDYPIRHPDEIREHLYTQQFRQHINRLNVPDSPEHYLKLARRYTFRDAWLPAGIVDKFIRKTGTIAAMPFKRKLLEATICTGSQWWAITPEFGRYVLKFISEHEEYDRYFRYLHSPDEHYFQTILENSPFAQEAPPMLTYTGRGMWKTANLHLIHPSLKKIYTAAEFDEVMSSNRYFVRKVNTGPSTSLLDQIDVSIGLSRDRSPSTLLQLART
jgi:hypothetical protein